MRRLPIFFLIDVSESMVGEQIQMVEDGLATIIKELKTDPYAIETVWVSIIVFAGQPRTLVPLQELITFYPPRFPIGSGTSLSQGLGHLMFELRKNVKKTTYEQKGDWKPIIFLFTDGTPTDDATKAIEEWRNNWARATNMVAVSFGDELSTRALHQLTENVLLFKNANADAYKKFFRWVTDSIKTSSESVDSGGSGFEMTRLDDLVITKSEQKPYDPRLSVDDNYVVIAAKCQNTKRPYLIKYRKEIVPANIPGLEDLQQKRYRLVGAFPVDMSYYELSYENGKKFSINTNELIGAPSCPCCGNQFGFASCGCGEIHCVGLEEVNPNSSKQSQCPSCNMSSKYGFGGDEAGFNVDRTQG